MWLIVVACLTMRHGLLTLFSVVMSRNMQGIIYMVVWTFENHGVLNRTCNVYNVQIQVALC